MVCISAAWIFKPRFLMGLKFAVVLLSADAGCWIRDFTVLVYLFVLRSLCGCFDAVFAVSAL